MNGSSQKEDLGRMSRQGFELMFQGVDMYNKMMRYWMDCAELSAREKGEDAARSVADNYSSFSHDYFSRFFGPLRSIANPSELFQRWQDYFGLYFAALPQQISMEKLTAFSKTQQDQVNRLANSWIDYINRMGDLSRQGREKQGDGQLMRDSLDSSEALLNSWLSFITEEARSNFQLLKLSVEEQIQKEQSGQQQQ